MPKTGNEFKYDQIRVVSWVDPGRVRGMMDGLTGLEVNEAIRDGRLPEPTLSRVLGIRCVAVSEGDVSAELTPRVDLENLGGTIHGGVLAALLDTVMGLRSIRACPPARSSPRLTSRSTTCAHSRERRA
jgi:hypothetical protein